METILVVDDEQDLADLIVFHAEKNGFRGVKLTNGLPVVATAQETQPSAIILDLMLPGVDGVELIRILRRRTQAGLLVVSGRLAPDVFSSVVDAGADMHLAKPASFDQVVVAIRAVHRRVASYSGSSGEWLLDRQAGRLIAPDGVRIDLSDLDLAVMERFVQAEGQAVTRESLCQHLGRPVTEEPDNTLSAIIYRLRRRIERATASPVPLQALSRVGYVFRGPLRSA
jgi:DNA-binding response OmpR family regulator